jgi:hypothetical protein
VKRRLISLAVAGLFAACGFPQLTYTDGAGDGGLDAPPGGDALADGTSSGGDTGPGGDGSGNGDVLGASDGEADEGSDATSDGSSADTSQDAIDEQPTDTGADALDCDQDKDGYRAATAQCGGNDCCDNDALAHPNETLFYTTADNCGSFDYNCDGSIETEYTFDLTCSGTPALGCKGGSGFIGDPGCGVSGPYGTCQANGSLTTCSAGSISTDEQGCM